MLKNISTLKKIGGNVCNLGSKVNLYGSVFKNLAYTRKEGNEFRNFDKKSNYKTKYSSNGRSNSNSRINRSDSYSRSGSEYQAIKTRRPNYPTKKEGELIRYNHREENKKVNRIIERPDEVVKLEEEDIHSALRQVGKLPELEMKQILENGLNDKLSHSEIYEQIKKNILKKINLCLNKSLVEICKIGKNNPDIFKNNEQFWMTLEKEIMTRQDSLSNSQITDTVVAFGKCNLTKNITFFEEMEEVILESPLPFQISQYERIFYSFCYQKKGSTAMVKFLSRKFFKYKDINDSWKMAKFYSELNSHPQTIKGNFGHLKDLEDQIKNDIETGRIKFDELISLAKYVFTDNISSNDTQKLIENALIEKFENNVEVDMSQVLKLVKSLSNYYIKNENLCVAIKNYIETYLNGYLQLENEGKTDEELNTPQSNINLVFNEQYLKLITQLNTLIWSFSKNKIFVNLKENNEFAYFYSRLKDVFIKNIDYYNGRELVFSLEGLLVLLENNKLNQNEKSNNSKSIMTPNQSNKLNSTSTTFTSVEALKINEKVEKLENLNNHDVIKMLKIFTQNSHLLKKVQPFEKLINLAVQNYPNLTYQEMLDFTDCIYNFSTQMDKHFTLHNENTQNLIKMFQNKFTNPFILPKIDILYLCKLVNIISRPLMNVLLDENFISEVEKILKIRINEIPKEQFCQILASSAKLKMNDTVENLINILEDLSHFENLEKCFDKPEEVVDLLWTLLSIYHRKNWSLKLNHQQSNFVENNIQKLIGLNKENKLQSEEFINHFLKTKLNLESLLTDNLHNREDNFSKYLQTVFFSFSYIKDFHNLNEKESREFLEKIKEELNANSVKFDMNSRSNFISLDPASKCDKLAVEDLQNEILQFFKKKPNTTIYPNFIDEYLNPVNILVYFEIPKLKENETVSGIDSKIFGVILKNKFYYNKHKELGLMFDNRMKILKEILNFEVLELNEEEWKNMNGLKKQEYLKNLFGYDLNFEDNIRIRIVNKNTQEIDNTASNTEIENASKKKRVPKFKLTQNLIKH